MIYTTSMSKDRDAHPTAEYISNFLITGLVVAILFFTFGITKMMLVQLDEPISNVSQANVFDIQSTAVVPTDKAEPQVAGAVTSEITAMHEYIEIIDSCGPYFEGECVRVRSGAGVSFPVVGSVRNGVVLKIDAQEIVDGETWYRVVFDEWLRYPNRIVADWYVAGSFVRVLENEGVTTIEANGAASTSKMIIVDRSDQTVTAYEGEKVFMESSISTGLALTPTPRGTFTIFKKTPTRYMQGPLPYIAGSDYYDLPGVPWNLYFTEQGAVIHGAYWHDSFGSQYSHGCVNMMQGDAEKLYHWADLGTTVIVRD